MTKANGKHRDESMADRLIRQSVDEGDCRVWTGVLTYNGYGKVRMKHRTSRAHRASYEAFVGPIPEGLEIDHLCRNRACIKPSHLEPVTRPENHRRRWLVNPTFPPHPQLASESHCANGHEWTPENTRIQVRPGKRDRKTCRTCAREETRRRRAADTTPK